MTAPIYSQQEIDAMLAVWFPPPFIPAGAYHVHLYNERTLQDADNWHGSASVLDLKPGTPGQERQRQRLRNRFIADMGIGFKEGLDRDLFHHRP